MRVARSSRWTKLGLAAALFAPAGCLISGNSGDPGPAFVAGQAGSTGSTGVGYAGSSGAGQGATGAAGAGAAGAGLNPVACPVAATATFELAWTLEDATGMATTCDAAGAQTVEVSARNLTTRAEALSTVPCAAAKATTCAMPAGDYAVSLKLRGPTGGLLSEIAAPTLFLMNGQVTKTGPLPFQVGGAATTGRGFALTWSIENADTQALLSCDAAGAATVRLVAGAKTFALPCAPGLGRTTALAPGDYPVTLSLLDAQGAELSVTQTMTLHVAAGQLVFLGDVVFDVI